MATVGLERFPRLNAFLSSGIESRPGGSVKLRRVRITNVLTLTLIVLTVPFVGLSVIMGQWRLTSAMLLMMLVCACGLVLLRYRQVSEISAHIIISMAFFMLVWANLPRGRLDDPSFGWLYLMPLAAILTTGVRGGWAWIVISMLTAIGFWFLAPGLETSGVFLETDFGLRVLFHRLAGPLAVGLLMTLAVSLQRQTEKNLETEIAIRKHAEEEARTADRVKGEFLANVSHEIRTPMNGVIGMTDLLMKADLPAAQHSQVEVINSSAETLLALVDDLLDFSKIEAGKLTLYAMDFRLRDLLEKVVVLLTPRAEEKGLDLRLVIDSELPDKLVGDAQRLRQVLFNLLGNAIKFTSEGSVAVSVELAEPIGDELWARFVVRDTGIGISPRDQARLFAPFSQADSTSARAFGGTGLGLAISKSLVEMMGGEIGLESTREVGSTFWFRLPLRQTSTPATSDVTSRALQALAVPASAPTVDDRGRYRILVVDDDAINRLVATTQLKDLGFESEAVENGKRAIRAVERQSFDVILMDCQMPDLDGYETTRWIRRKQTSGQRPVIIAVTAYTIKGEREKCLAAGMDDFMTKPFRGEELETMVDRWLLIANTDPKTGAELSAPDASERRVALHPEPLAAARKLGHKTGKDMVGQMIKIFEHEAPVKIEKMRRALMGEDAKSLVEAAHALGGSAVYMGAEVLAKRCREVVETARLEGLGGCEARLAALEEEHRRVRLELEEQAS